jgi:hypothetical protein
MTDEGSLSFYVSFPHANITRPKILSFEQVPSVFFTAIGGAILIHKIGYLTNHSLNQHKYFFQFCSDDPVIHM